MFKNKTKNKQTEKNPCCRTTVRMPLSEKHDPNFLPEKPLGIFAFPTSPIPSSHPRHVFFRPFELPVSLLFLSNLLHTRSVRCCVSPTSYCCVYHPSICLHSLQRQLCFVWRGKRKQECPPTTTHTHTHTPATQMDHTTL